MEHDRSVPCCTMWRFPQGRGRDCIFSAAGALPNHDCRVVCFAVSFCRSLVYFELVIVFKLMFSVGVRSRNLAKLDHVNCASFPQGEGNINTTQKVM